VPECKHLGKAIDEEVRVAVVGAYGINRIIKAMSAEPQGKILVGVVMGSRNDYAVMRSAVEVLKEFGVAHEARVVSAHRTPDLLFEYAEAAVTRGLRVIIAGAGGAAHLPGMLAAKTVVPVLGVPIAATTLQGQDSLLSIVQMPKGIPVGTLAIGPAGAMNAGLLAVAILATTDAALRERLIAWRAARRDDVLAQVVGDDEASA
jgi:5-(carboxyamino)imidazole ribonucleotide mutase